MHVIAIEPIIWLLSLVCEASGAVISEREVTLSRGFHWISSSCTPGSSWSTYLHGAFPLLHCRASSSVRFWHTHTPGRELRRLVCGSRIHCALLLAQGLHLTATSHGSPGFCCTFIWSRAIQSNFLFPTTFRLVLETTGEIQRTMGHRRPEDFMISR